MFEVELTPLCYTQASGHHRRDFRDKRMNDTSLVKQAVYLWRKALSFSDATDNLYFDVPREVYTTHPGCKSLMCNVPRLLQEECVQKKKREKSGFKLLMRRDYKNIA